mmetsp:Transcript_54331/g.128178  ORF Transcript_54331/g.128178 Transcript_54331/m.128178 type:complete len:107 (-) Transcript_54331:56-376(-)
MPSTGVLAPPPSTSSPPEPRLLLPLPQHPRELLSWGRRLLCGELLQTQPQVLRATASGAPCSAAKARTSCTCIEHSGKEGRKGEGRRGGGERAVQVCWCAPSFCAY